MAARAESARSEHGAANPIVLFRKDAQLHYSVVDENDVAGTDAALQLLWIVEDVAPVFGAGARDALDAEAGGVGDF